MGNMGLYTSFCPQMFLQDFLARTLPGPECNLDQASLCPSYRDRRAQLCKVHAVVVCRLVDARCRCAAVVMIHTCCPGSGCANVECCKTEESMICVHGSSVQDLLKTDAYTGSLSSKAPTRPHKIDKGLDVLVKVVGGDTLVM